MLRDWRALFETTKFRGITTDGTLIPGLFSLGGDEQAPVPAAVTAANALLAGLSPGEADRLRHPLASKVWRAWMNPEFYVHRFGLRLEELGAPQRDLVLGLVRSSLSPCGYQRVRDVLHINAFVGDLVGLPRILNENSYNINLFSMPSLDEPWGWSLYGHHLCLNCLFIGGQQVLTPVFLGAEPNEIDTGDHAGTVLFTEQEQAGLELVRSLPPDVREQAILYRSKRDPAMPPGRLHPGDELHLGGAFQDNRVIPNEGVPAVKFPPEQRGRLVAAVELFLDYLPDGPRAARLAEVWRHLDETWFCWIGGTGHDDPFYYRIQSPVIMLEFDHHAGVFLANSEPERFHIHTLVRTPNGNDYGAALVRQATGTPHLLDGPD